MSRMEGNDAAMVAQAVAGDREAFRFLVERHSHGVFRLAFRMTGNEHDAEEVVQEAFLRAYRRLAGFESRANFGTWLYRITVNCALDFVRVRQRHTEHRQQPSADPDQPELMESLEADGPTPDRLAESEQMRRRVSAAMLELTPVERTAFTLRHFEGHSIQEIGRTLGLRTSATKNSIFRAVQKLRRSLAPLAHPRGSVRAAGAREI
ncbi:MAG: RNA polymerase sigma factor [Candidatus Acidiferrales bacterium]